MNAKWDARFLALAEHVAQWSRDPSTKTGAVIVGEDGRRVVSLGYNGFPRGVDDAPGRYADRGLKYKIIVHCERNAIVFAQRNLSHCTLYTWPFMSCSACAGLVIQAGIARCVAPRMPPDKEQRWAEDMAVAEMMFREAGVALVLV